MRAGASDACSRRSTGAAMIRRDGALSTVQTLPFDGREQPIRIGGGGAQSADRRALSSEAGQRQIELRANIRPEVDVLDVADHPDDLDFQTIAAEQQALPHGVLAREVPL